MEPETAAETVEARITRLSLVGLPPPRVANLALAHATGVSDETFALISRSRRVSKKETVLLPAHRYEGLSRGRGWCRQGKGDKAVWGERTDNGYRVGPGKWVVGATDGFSRKDSDTWEVEAVRVGAQTWTIAN